MHSTLLFLMCVTTQAGGEVYSHLRLPLHGTLHKKTLYGVFGNSPHDLSVDAIPIENPPKARFESNMFDLSRKPGDAVVTKAGWKCYWTFFGGPGNFRHQIKYDSIWLTTGPIVVSRLKFRELHFFDTSNKDLIKQYAEKYPRREDVGSVFYHIPLRTMYESYKKSFYQTEGAGGARETARNVLAYGTVPTSDNSCKCYMLIKPNKYVEVWDTHFRWDEKIQRWKTTEDGRNLERIEPPFSEDFHLFLNKDDYFFVTQSGKLYHAPARKDGRMMKALWTDAKRPIVAVIEDADRGKVWLFAKDKNAGAKIDLYFEMKDTIKTESFDPAKLRPVNVEGRAKTLLEYLPLISTGAKR